MISVVTQLKYPKEMNETVDSLTERSVAIFRTLKGFISMEVNKNLEETSTLSYLQWEKFEDHENCMKDAAWNEINPEWQALMSREDVDFQFLFVGEPKWTAKN